MNFGIIFFVFALQLVMALIVIAVLMHLLGRELTEAALEELEGLKSPQDAGGIKSVAVVSHAQLSNENVSRIKSVVGRKFKGASVEFSTDNTLQGGVMVRAGATVIDCSVKKRLEKLWGRGE